MINNISPYLEKKMLITLSMGFVSGVPLLLTITLLQAWLTDEGISKSTIGLFALVGLPYSLKFIWAPIFDYFTISKLGRRRGWLLVTQILLIISIIALGMGNPALNAWNVALLATLVAISSASQDIVIDAYRRESLTDEEQTIGASAYVLGYRIGALAAGAGGLILADYMSYQMVYAIMSMIMLYGVFITIIADEPKQNNAPSNFTESVIGPFTEFFGRYVSKNRKTFDRFKYLTPILILSFILLYKLFATLIGAFIGGLLSLKIGLYRSLIIFGIFQAIATLGFAVLASAGDNIYLLIIVVSLENLAAGMGYTAYLAFIANMTNRGFTATQFALMTALMSLPRTLFSSYSGFLVEILDWELYFIFCSLIAFPALIILMKLNRRMSI